MRCSVRKIKSYLHDDTRCVVKYTWYPGRRQDKYGPQEEPSIDLMSVVVDGEDCLEDIDEDTAARLLEECWDDHIAREYRV